MTRIHLLRHAQTDCTRTDRFCSRHDPALNATGVCMAHMLAQSDIAPRWTAIYASPAARAGGTASIAAQRYSMEVKRESAFAELDYGDWDDLPRARVAVTDRYRLWCDDPERIAPPGGETAVQAASRASAAIDRILARHPDGDVLVVTHKAIIRILVCHYLGVSLNRFRESVSCPVSSLTCFTFGTSEPLLTTLGVVTHLPRDWRPDPDHVDGSRLS